MIPISNKNAETFENIYLSYFSKLKRFALEYVLYEEDAENIIQDLFTDLWRKKEIMTEHTNLTSLLFISVKNRCLNYLRHDAMKKKHMDKLREENLIMLRMNLESLEVFDDHVFSEPDIDRLVQEAINTLPEKCRRIFYMSKIEGKKRKEIAEELHISLSTIDSQMQIAYRKLKEELKDYMPLYLFLCFLTF